MSKKEIVIIVILIIFTIFLSSTSYYLLNKDVDVILKDNLNVKVFDEVSVNDFIEKVNKGTVISDDELVNTSSLGKKDIRVKVKNKFGKESFYSFNINVVDDEAPIIDCEKNLISIAGEDYDVLGNVKVSDNSKENIKASIDGKFDLSTPGEYKFDIVAKDSSGNEAREEVILTVNKRTNTSSKYLMADRNFTTANGFDAVIKDGILYIDGILIANKTFSLPYNYGNGLTKETKAAFDKMKKDAASMGLNIYISSGFRSFNIQTSIYNNYVYKNGKTEADTYSARAGHSEHQTGLAFDVNDINQAFADTKEGKWLDENSYKYGFILRYPKGKNNETGYIYEPWHFRYVGEELAKILYNDGEWITLEDYFGITSEYNY